MRAINIDPDDTISLGNLCYVYLLQNKYQEVIELLENTLIEDIIHSRLWFLLARAHYEQGDIHKAFKYINISYDAYPHDRKVEKLRDEISRKLT
jgi:tetratricopeptide (TPR) repeat protein